MNPKRFLQIKDDLKKASPTHWREFGCIGMFKDKAGAKEKAIWMANECQATEEELQAIKAVIDNRNDIWKCKMIDWNIKQYSLEDLFQAMDEKGATGVVVAMCNHLGIELWEVNSNGEPTGKITKEGKEIQQKLKEIRGR